MYSKTQKMCEYGSFNLCPPCSYQHLLLRAKLLFKKKKKKVLYKAWIYMFSVVCLFSFLLVGWWTFLLVVCNWNGHCTAYWYVQ